MKQALLLFVLVCFSLTSYSAIDAYPFPNDEMRGRYNALIDELRCPQCLNTNLAGSDAMVAKDLRREVHRLVLEGKSDDEIRAFMLARYGDFILYDPQLKPSTFLLWFAPAAFFLIAVFFAFRVINAPRASTDLSEDERTRLKKLMNSDQAEQ